MIENKTDNWVQYQDKLLATVVEYIENEIKIAERSGEYPTDREIKQTVILCGDILNSVDLQDIFLQVIDRLPNSYKYCKYIDIWLNGEKKWNY